MIAFLRALFQKLFSPADQAAVQLPAPSIALGGVNITPQALRMMGVTDPDRWVPLLVKYMGTAGILVNNNRASMFLANVLHETGGFRRLVETLDYSPDRLAAIWPNRFAEDGKPTRQACMIGRLGTKPADQRAIAEAVYGGRGGNVHPGDGWKYRGRGLMQTTFRGNYAAVQAATGQPVVDRPELLEVPEIAVQSACIYWQQAGCNRPADAGDIKEVRRRVNGGEIGLSDVRLWQGRVLRALTATQES